MRTAVSGTVAAAGLRRTRRMPLYEIALQDESGRLKALWFNQPYLRDVLPRGSRVVLYGDVQRDGRALLMASPQFEKLEDDDAGGVHTGRIVPVYEKTGPLTGRMLRRVLFTLAAQVPDDVPDPLPPEVRERLGLIGARRRAAPRARAGRGRRPGRAGRLPQPGPRPAHPGGAVPVPARPGPAQAGTAVAGQGHRFRGDRRRRARRSSASCPST